jgi:hypothetical protein
MARKEIEISRRMLVPRLGYIRYARAESRCEKNRNSRCSRRLFEQNSAHSGHPSWAAINAGS